MAGRVARPLLGLTESVRSFSEGKLKSLPQVRTGDEIESLAEAFNRMAERIQQQVERLETANRELATLDRMKTDLLANVSHELRTPLAAIRGYVEFIQEGQLGPTTDAQRKGLEVCLRNSERLTKTINMLLDFSRMELGRVPIRPAPFQIGRLLAQIVAGIEADARKRRIRLKTVVDRDLKPVDGDRDRLTQVLENLITNALKFTPDGGEVEVGATAGRRTRDASRSGSPTPASASRPRSAAGSSTSSTRPTLPRPGSSAASGSGSRSSSRSSTRTGRRSSSTAAPERAPSSVSPSPSPRPRRSRASSTASSRPTAPTADVLAIDDDSDFLAILRETLGKHGFTVRTATTAAEGLAAARERPPLLIVLDIRLPDRDGLDLLQELREDEATRRTPILVASVVDERLEGLRLGAVEYLVKPIDRGRLVEAAVRALHARGGSPPVGGNPGFSGGLTAPRGLPFALRSHRHPGLARREEGLMSQRQRTILIVDDEEDVLDLLQLVFETSGFEVRRASTGKSAVSSAYEQPPDVVLLDVMMPEMDGWQVLRTLKGDERTRHIPVVMLSARAERRDKMIGLQEGAEGYIAKPFSPAEVVREVQSFLERGP